MCRAFKSVMVGVLALMLVALPVMAAGSNIHKRVPGAARLVTPEPTNTVTRIPNPVGHLPMQIENILLVDDDGGANNGNGDPYLDIQDYYTDALDSTGYSYDTFIVDWTNPATPSDGPSYTEMLNYDCIIWFTGETWGYYGLDVLTVNDENNLSGYLDMGGMLFLNAQDYLYANYPSAGSFSAGQFPYDYLGLSSVLQDVYTPPSTVQGATGSFAEGLSYVCLNPYPDATLWSDSLAARDQALLNVNNTQHYLAVQYEGANFYTAFSTCGVEGLLDGTYQVWEYVNAVLEGFEAAGVTPIEEPVEVTGYLLNQNYPNPFNPNTEIRYQLPVHGTVTLTIYNTMGQQVATLVNGQQPPGAYRVTWNAADLPSGIYFYRLGVNDFQDIRRMILLK
jgi:hypothetical protein